MAEIVIIPAAGLATRLRPISNSMSKAMVPVVGKPILARIISSIRDKVDQIIVITGDNGDIETYVKNLQGNTNITTVKQGVANGPLGAVLVGASHLDIKDEDSVTIWLGDTLVDSEAEIDSFLKYDRNADQNLVHLGVSEVEDFSRWCMFHYADKAFYDKPEVKPPTKMALIGLYRFQSGKMFKEMLNNAYETTVDHESLELIHLLKQKDTSYRTTNFKSWLDCGDLPSLHNATSALINSKSRSHNTVSINGQVVNKKLDNSNEVSWYKAVQSDNKVKSIIPQFLGEESNGSFNIELCSGNSLQDMLVYDNIRPDCWSFIIKTVVEAYSNTFNSVIEEPKFDPHHMFFWNIEKRLKKLGVFSGDIRHFVEESYGMLPQLAESSVIHGDFHFGNILYDASCNKVKLIDPRGEWCGIQTTTGNILYDLAKFYQSFYAKYAWIVSDEPVNEKMRQELIYITDLQLNSPKIATVAKRYSIILLMSAIPLHYDNPVRQRLMMDTAIELIGTYK